jgi:magnesium-transporting ATPase (P-type)
MALATSLTNGVMETDPAGGVDARRAAFGANAFKQAKSKSFFALFFENLKDPTLVLLMGAALVSWEMREREKECAQACPQPLGTREISNKG